MLRIKKQDLDQIIAEAKKGYPNEVCGILAGKDGLVTKVYKMTNLDKSTTTFLADPREQLQAFKEMDKLGIEMLGIYHSHPASPAYPSKRDCELAFYPNMIYVIVSLVDLSKPELRAFKIVDGIIECLRSVRQNSEFTEFSNKGSDMKCQELI